MSSLVNIASYSHRLSLQIFRHPRIDRCILMLAMLGVQGIRMASSRVVRCPSVWQRHIFSTTQCSNSYDSTIANLRLDGDTTVIYQGFTGKAVNTNPAQRYQCHTDEKRMHLGDGECKGHHCLWHSHRGRSLTWQRGHDSPRFTSL